ncbi:Alpha/Beta hydrolase protein [Aspergillus pseudodeflectus]|uniref:Alpha/Beta hydrolase protein n=1 Tax=Aspergillus pseudodeflectus TaxID=176178 RepID=A0ABR4KG82_9EURO
MTPESAIRTTLDPGVEKFTKGHPELRLGESDLLQERRIHAEIFGFTAHPKELQAPIGRVEFTAFRGPHGTINLRVLYPSKSHHASTKSNLSPALIYFHGGGYSVGTGDEFENGCRILAEKSGIQVYLVDYRLAPEWPYPTQLDEYEAVLEWLAGEGGSERRVDSNLIFGAGDSAGGNMTAAITLRLRDRQRHNLAGIFLLYPEARLPFDTKAAGENNTGPYLNCNGIFQFAGNYIPSGVPPSCPYISPGQLPTTELKDLPPARVYTCGFDCLRDVGAELACKLQDVENDVTWRHYETLSHGFLQMAPWSSMAMNALTQVGEDAGILARRIAAEVKQ